MRGWQRLRGWVDEEAQSARIFRRLLDTARLWSDGKAGLFRDPESTNCTQVGASGKIPNADWAEEYGGDFATAINFLQASKAAAEAERQAKEAARSMNCNRPGAGRSPATAVGATAAVRPESSAR